MSDFMITSRRINFGFSCKYLHECIQWRLNMRHENVFYRIIDNRHSIIGLCSPVKTALITLKKSIRQRYIYVAKYDPFFTNLLGIPDVLSFGSTKLYLPKNITTTWEDTRYTISKGLVPDEFSESSIELYYDSSACILVATQKNKCVYMTDVVCVHLQGKIFKYTIGTTEHSINICADSQICLCDFTRLNKDYTYLIVAATKDIIAVYRGKIKFIIPCISWSKYQSVSSMLEVSRSND